MTDWEESARKELVPKVRDAHIVMTLLPRNGEPDPKIALETGYAVWLNKPIVVIVRGDDPVPPGLARVATSIARISHSLDSPEGQAELEKHLFNTFAALEDGDEDPRMRGS